MPPLYIKPENALKRSEELLALGTKSSQEQAFDNLVEVFQSKRFKHTPVATLEPIMFKFIDLCVELQRRSYARYALLAYRNAIQSTNASAIESVLNHFIASAEAKLAAATEQAKKEVSALPEHPMIDDELPLQPNALLLDTFIDNTNDRERIERRLIAPAQKFCWDAYDICLDVSKLSDRFEVIYQSIAHRAFEFCKIHQRKSDFRKLCEQRLRKDLTNIGKYQHQPHHINLSEPETLSRHLDTRFLQLETAVELELWQEAFRSVEDVHGLVAGKKQARPSMMANYYEKLTQIFKAEGGRQTAIFHAAAWSRYYQYAERAGAVPEKAAGCVLLSALAVPLGDVETKQRLIALLNLPKMPTRESLVKDAAARHLRRVHPAIRQLYNTLETDFQPLQAAKTLAPLITSLPAEYQPYLPALREVVLSRLLHGLSEVYDTISLSHVLEMVQPFEGTPFGVSMADLEKYLMTAARKGEINASIDHLAKSLTFTVSPIETDRLANLAICLHNTVNFLQPPPASIRSDAFAAAIAAAEEERKATAHRRQIVIKRRELLEEANIRKAKEDATQRAERLKAINEENARREKEMAKQMEIDSLRQQMEKTRKDEAAKLVKTLKESGALKVDLKDEELVDPNQVRAIQIQQLDKEKREMNDRLRIVGKRVDHLERALRKEERPLLADDYERQKAEDKIEHEEMNKQARADAIARQAAERDLKERLSRMLPDYMSVRQEVEKAHAKEFEKAREAAKEKIKVEKEKFKQKVMERRKKDKERREKQRAEEEAAAEAERQRREEEARAAAEAEEKEAAERAEAEKKAADEKAKAEAIRQQRAAERAEADAAAKRQREREEEAEKRRAERSSGAGALRRPVVASASPAASPALGERQPLKLASRSTAPTDGSPSGSPAPTERRPLNLAPRSGAAGGAPSWRDKEALKTTQNTSSPTTPTDTRFANSKPDSATSTPPNGATGANGESGGGGKYVPGQGRYSSRGRGGGTTNTPPSTRGAAPGSRW